MSTWRCLAATATRPSPRWSALGRHRRPLPRALTELAAPDRVDRRYDGGPAPIPIRRYAALGYRISSGTTAAPAGGVNVKSESGNAAFAATFVKFIVTVFSS